MINRYYKIFSDPIWWTRVPRSESQLFYCLCNYLLPAGFCLFYTANNVYSCRMAENESPFLSSSLQSYYTKIALLCSISSINHSWSIFYFSGNFCSKVYRTILYYVQLNLPKPEKMIHLHFLIVDNLFFFI